MAMSLMPSLRHLYKSGSLRCLLASLAGTGSRSLVHEQASMYMYRRSCMYEVVTSLFIELQTRFLQGRLLSSCLVDNG